MSERTIRQITERQTLLKLIGVVSVRRALSSDLAPFECDLAEHEHIAEILG